VSGLPSVLLALAALGPAADAPEPHPGQPCEVNLVAPDRWRGFLGELSDGPEGLGSRALASMRPSFPLDAVPEGWAGRGWFEGVVRIPPALRSRSLGVFVAHVGAYEVFIGRRRVASAGFPPPGDPWELPARYFELGGVFTSTRAEVPVAVHINAPVMPLDSFMGLGVRIQVCPAIEGLERLGGYEASLRMIYAGFVGFTLALGLLHLFLHLHARDGRAGHLDYAVFTLGTAMLSGTVLVRSLGTTLAENHLYVSCFLLALILLSTFGTRFFAGVALGPESKVRRYALLAAVPLVGALPWLSVELVYTFALAELCVMCGLVIQLVRRRHPDRFLIAFGVLAMVAAATAQMVPLLFDLGVQSDFAFIPGFVILLLLMSVHLSRTVGRTHAELAGRIREVESLSEANLEEQARAQQEAIERMALEAENRRQAERLAAAETRAALLDELEVSHRRLKEMQTQLVQSEKMAALGQLVAGVAHEMNTPIGAIQSVHGSLAAAADKLRRRIDALAPEAAADPKLAAALAVLSDGADVIAKGSERVSSIVKRLRTFARLDEAELQRVDLHDGIEDTLVLARHELKHGIEVIRDYGALPPVACYPGQLNQLFLNLIMNARQAMGASGTLTLRTRDLGDAVEVRVIDDGPGIAPEDLERIFDPGFTTKGVGVGTGLGLAICYRIAEAHRGTLTAESAPGQGATFTLRIPKDFERI
jgi:signal transduction histidine kinase